MRKNKIQTLSIEAVADYCSDCYYYRGLPTGKCRCYYRIWEQDCCPPPSNLLRVTGRCKHYVNVKRSKRT
jgi:hypothetical protein